MSTAAGVAIAGAAESDLGVVAAGTTPGDLMAQASLRALADCGLEVADVDGLFAATSQLPMASVTLAEELRIGAGRTLYTDSTQIGGSSPIAHLEHARAAIGAGLCDVALIAYGSTQRSVGRASAAIREVSPWEEPYRPMLPVAAYALAASRHMHEFGTTREQLAEVAVAARAWAATNPRAWSREPLSVQDVLAAPMVCDPLGVRDCCLVTDGGGALVVTSAERARTLRRPPVHVLGVGTAHAHRHISEMADLTRTAAADSGARAFAQAGLTPADVDVLELYDAFTITPILFLEDLGFCAKGDGGAFVSDGRIAPGGALPVNTNGGGLSYGHPGMYGLQLLVEAVRQVRGEAGAGQVDGCHVALAHGNGGVLSSQCTALLGDEAAAGG
jgi:acetyl-CoA acetyltransferase